MSNEIGLIQVLYLEDNKYDRKLFKSIFSTYYPELEIKIASNKEEYLTLLSDFQPDIVVSDFNLPEISGIDAFQYANVVLTDFTFMIFSSHLTEEQVKNCIQNGISRIVMKDDIKRLIFHVEEARKSLKKDVLK